jgi:cytochrome c556
MKYIITTIISALLATTLFAGNTTEQAKLASDMRSMLNATVDIQRAGFYSNKAGIQDSAKSLISSLDSLITTDAKQYLPDDQANAGKFAKKRAKMIKMYAEDLIESVENNDFEEAIEDYSQILRQCTSCHSRIRHREWK